MDKEALYTDAIHTFLQIQRYLTTYARQARAEGLSGRKIAALRRLLSAGPQTIGQLSAYHYISDSSASEMVSELVQAGYVTRARSEADQRVVIVELTPAGAEFARNAPLGGIPLLRERLRAMPPDDLAAVNAALVTIARLLEIDHGT
ncbi:MAG: winged helix DNA-binding protein [Anaerolineae bacterium]|nr:winged helix DNA-binding protein [Anaerolineae bacterium]